MTIPITISRKVQTPFKLRALRAFPREFIGFLVGRRAEDRLEVPDMFFRRTSKSMPLMGTHPCPDPCPATGERWSWSMRPNRR